MVLKDLQHSFSLLKKNPVIFLPDLFQILVSYIMIYIIYYYTGASSLVPLLESTETASIQAISSFISTNLLQIIVSIISFIVVTFIVGIGVMIFKYTLITESVTGKKVSIKTAWKENQDLFIPIVLLRILLFLICLAIVAIIAGISLLLYFIVAQFNPDIGVYAAILLGLVLFIVSFLFLKLFTLFRYPVMFFKKLKHPVKALKDSFAIFKKDSWFVFYTWIVMAVISLIFSLITYSFSTLINNGVLLIQNATLIMVVTSVWLILDILIGLTGQLLTEIYLFFKYSKRQSS